MNDTDTLIKNFFKKPSSFFISISKLFHLSTEKRIDCLEPFQSFGGKYEGLSKIEFMTKDELEIFLCREVSQDTFDMITFGGIPAAAFTLPEINWSDVEKVTNIENYEMIKKLLSNKKFVSLLDEDQRLALQDLYMGTAPVSSFRY